MALKRFKLSMVCTLSCCLLIPAQAWGPKAELTMVSNASQLLAKSTNLPMRNMDAEIRQGAMISRDMLKGLYPAFEIDPIRSIESEMFLLRKVRQETVDAYFAYRLGTLGKLITKTTTPMTNSEPGYRSLYLSDVENNIQGVELMLDSRESIDPVPYFQSQIRMANRHNDAILKEYKNGTGFQGLAKTMLSQDASRSVTAVTDVWYTIFSGGSATGGISQEHLRRYVIDALEFYVARGNGAEVDAAAERYEKMVSTNPDMLVSIGDHLYNGGFLDRAVGYYESVLAQDSDRPDVAKKIADYYMRKGQDAMDEDRLEAAEEAFALALQAHTLHPDAEAARLNAAKMIRERDARLEDNRVMLAKAEEYEFLAEDEAMNQRYAESFVLLRQSWEAYSQVSDEFPLERQKSVKGMQAVRERMTEMKDQLILNAQQFSGTGFGQDAQDLARQYATQFDQDTLKAILEGAYSSGMKALEQSLQDELRIQ